MSYCQGFASSEADISRLRAELTEVHMLVFNSTDEAHAELIKELHAWDRHSTANITNGGVIQGLRAELTALRSVCAEAYQLAGAIGAPVKVLDSLSAAAKGQAIPHETFLPILDTDCVAVTARDEALKAAEDALRMARPYVRCTDHDCECGLNEDGLTCTCGLDESREVVAAALSRIAALRGGKESAAMAESLGGQR